MKENDFLKCRGIPGYSFTIGLRYLIFQDKSLFYSTLNQSLCISDDDGRTHNLFDPKNNLWSQFNAIHFTLETSSIKSALLSDTLTPNNGELIYEIVSGTEYEYLGRDASGFYYLNNHLTNVGASFTKDYLNVNFTYTPPTKAPIMPIAPTPSLPFLPYIPSVNTPYTIGPGTYNISRHVLDSITFGNMSQLPKSDPIVHKNCRHCKALGSHNVVNHKEYYWCNFCKDEC